MGVAPGVPRGGDGGTVLKTVDDSAEPQGTQPVAETANDSVASCVALFGQESPDLAGVVRARPDLREAVQAGVPAAVKTTRED